MIFPDDKLSSAVDSAFGVDPDYKMKLYPARRGQIRHVLHESVKLDGPAGRLERPPASLHGAFLCGPKQVEFFSTMARRTFFARPEGPGGPHDLAPPGLSPEAVFQLAARRAAWLADRLAVGDYIYIKYRKLGGCARARS